MRRIQDLRFFLELAAAKGYSRSAAEAADRRIDRVSVKGDGEDLLGCGNRGEDRDHAAEADADQEDANRRLPAHDCPADREHEGQGEDSDHGPGADRDPPGQALAPAPLDEAA
jgi:hypothetical protein